MRGSVAAAECLADVRAGVALPDDGALLDDGTTTGGVTTGIAKREAGSAAA